MTQLEVADLIKFLFVAGGVVATYWWPRHQRQVLKRLRNAAENHLESVPPPRWVVALGLESTWPNAPPFTTRGER